MPIRDGGAPVGGRGFGTVTNRERRTIVLDVIDSISYASTVQRNSNDINGLARKTGFHIDAAYMSSGDYAGYYKVDIQRGRGTKDTVAQVMVEDGVSSHNDIQDALTESLDSGHKWIVTN